jgi:hypothetical protein
MKKNTRRLSVILSEAKDLLCAYQILRFAQDDCKRTAFSSDI